VSESIHERRSCGAQIRLEGSPTTITQVSASWRRDHWHTESDGICGDATPELTLPGGETRVEYCSLRVGHKGMHHSQEGANWSYGSGATTALDHPTRPRP